jgi:hypothetical protein
MAERQRGWIERYFDEFLILPLLQRTPSREESQPLIDGLGASHPPLDLPSAIDPPDPRSCSFLRAV